MAKTITLKINERSSFGKTILELIEIAVREKKGVEVIKNNDQHFSKNKIYLQKELKALQEQKSKLISQEELENRLSEAL